MKRIVKALSLLLTICLLAGMLAGCGSNNGGQSNTGVQNDNDDDPKPVKDTLTVVNNSEVQSCDPSATTAAPTFQCLSQMLETLVELDEDGNYVMHLAESIEQTDDVTYLVYLRKGVKFHNGEEMKASDVVFTYQRACASAKAAANLGELDPEGIVAIDDYTVQFKTKTPIATFYNVLTRNNGMILNQKAVEEAGENADRSCIGTGPYKFVDWQAGVQITMEAFNDYWGEKKASIPNVVYKFVDDANSRVVMLEAGEADMIYSVPATGVDILLNNEDVVVHEQASNSVRWFFINTNVEPTNNIDVRKAIAYALDTEALTYAVFGDHAVAATSFLAPNIMGHTSDLELYSYNVEKAKEHLAAAGYEDGLDIKLTMWSQTVQNSMAEIIQAQLGAVGINVEIEALESAAFSAALGTGEIQIGLATNSNTSRDPDSAAKVFKSENFPKPNYAGLNVTAIDDLLAEGVVCTDPVEREQIYVEVQQLAAEECCIIPLCYENDIYAVSADLKGFFISKSGNQKFVNYSF